MFAQYTYGLRVIGTFVLTNRSLPSHTIAGIEKEKKGLTVVVTARKTIQTKEMSMSKLPRECKSHTHFSEEIVTS